MHIPSEMLNGAVCPISGAAAAAGIGVSIWAAKKSKSKPSVYKFASVTSLIFALQMLNYPIQNGTSGHLVGAVLAAAFLGIPFAVLSMTIVLAVQAFFFADGGINALGANIFNMALIGVACGGFLYHYMKKTSIALMTASFVSVIAGAFACSAEVALSGAVNFNKVLPAMISVHSLIGIGEALITVSVVYGLNYAVYKKNLSFSKAAFSLTVIAVVLSPLASSFPDGLEWVSAKLSFLEFTGSSFSAAFADYHAAFINNAAVSTVLAGIAGILIVFGFTFFSGKLLKDM